MPERRRIEEAAEVFRRLMQLESSGGVVPTWSAILEAAVEYEGIEFNVSDGADADGFLFQYGVDRYSETVPVFVVELVRQLEVPDEFGEHGCYVQISCTVRYEVDDALSSVAAWESWWFRGSEIPFTSWIRDVSGRSILRSVRDRRAIGFSVDQSEV